MLILESSVHNVMVTVIPPTPVVSTADILDYQLSISGPLEDQEYTLSEDMRYIASYIGSGNRRGGGQEGHGSS